MSNFHVLSKEFTFNNQMNSDFNIKNKYNIKLKFNKNFIKKYKKIDEIYKEIFRMDEDYHLLNVLKYYENNKDLEIINYIKKIDHDGYDIDGPESNLYYLRVYYRKKNNCNIYIDKYSREYWYIGEDDEPYEKH
tara:strand:+ start:1456 stop:1857 length:402 start_codon:yes stop_codon:yes gene_type:complete